jgi:LacI family repressor for deo operon, udp, cdd, tsx, nupC, and nupG
VGELRNLGYRQEMADCGLEVLQEWTSPASRFTRQEGEARAEELLDEGAVVDALVCASDLLAFGAMRAFRRRGVRVPNDVAVVGWDNTVDAEYHLPTLTSVASDLSRLADLTLDALTSRIEGNRAAGEAYVVPHEIVVRASSRPAATDSTHPSP